MSDFFLTWVYEETVCVLYNTNSQNLIPKVRRADLVVANPLIMRLKGINNVLFMGHRFILLYLAMSRSISSMMTQFMNRLFQKTVKD